MPWLSTLLHVYFFSLKVDGTILANTGSTAWRSGYATQWLEFKSVRGLTIQGCGVIDGQGSHWWSRNPLVDQGQTTTVR